MPFPDIVIKSEFHCSILSVILHRTWRARTREGKETRRLSELGRQRAEARVKVDQFLDSLKQLRRDLRSDVDRLG